MKPPEFIIIARHGARLDAADPQWHFTSPTPYDPPLTYGGWKQAQALGARIASIINLPEDPSTDRLGHKNGLEGESHPIHHTSEAKRRRHRVVIHSSPFLRCVQTSIGIGAGLHHWNGLQNRESKHVQLKSHKPHSGSPHLSASDHPTASHLTAIPEPEEMGRHSIGSIAATEPKNSLAALATLRLDAFLGEWLSPDYFENITPPPGSRLMVASAKADLLRRGEPIEMVQHQNAASKTSNFPGGWHGDDGVPDGMDDLSDLKSSLPKLVRANTHSVFSAIGTTSRHVTSRSDGPTGDGLGYSPPKPSYAVSTVQPIPQGYVAHARDACMRVDYQWDSMRPPLEWGYGGEYGEEWSAMHKRFRKGLHDMISWYRNNDLSQQPEQNESLEELRHVRTNVSESDENDEDYTVLILVTHGAGCNALIGALTDQPVLIDVGLGSLTLAVRKHGEHDSASNFGYRPSPFPRNRRSSLKLGLSEEYDIKLTASTDHTRPGSRFLDNTSPRARSPTAPVREKSPYRYERHVGSPTRQHANRSPINDMQDKKPIRQSVGSFEEDGSSGRVRRANTTAGSSQGLWSRPGPQGLPTNSSSDPETITPPKDTGGLRGDAGRPKVGDITSTKSAEHPRHNDRGNVKPLPQHGLWTSEVKRNGNVSEPARPKRRWTASHA